MDNDNKQVTITVYESTKERFKQKIEGFKMKNQDVKVSVTYDSYLQYLMDQEEKRNA